MLHKPMRRTLLLLMLVSLLASGQEDKKGNIFTDAGDAAKMVLGKQKLYAGNYIQALNNFRDVETRNPQNAEVKYYVGLCFYNLGQNKNALEALEKAVAIGNGVKPETRLLLAKLYQKGEQYEKALGEVRGFNSTDEESVREAALVTSQCENALHMTRVPVNVAVNNLGEGINSKYDDKNPCITADGKKMIFTSRRPETTSSPTDLEGDGKYFEGIYMTDLDSAGAGFTSVTKVPGSVNTPAHDACTSISPDGRQLFIYKNDADKKESRGGNVFVSRITSGKWKAPESLGKPVNSSYWEGGACVSADGKRYFFSSERPDGQGQSDIWMVEKIGKEQWGTPLNLGAEVNSPYDEAGMFLAPDGKTLFFCSNGPRSMGGYDVFRTVYENGKWSMPENLGYPINSSGKEGQLTISADARTAYISSDRPGGMGESDLYKIDLKDYAILEKGGKRQKGNELSILRGVIREGFEGYGVQDASIMLKDNGGKEIASTTTNENGEYFFMLKGGTYTLEVNKNGYSPISEKVEVLSSDRETVIVEKGYLLKK
jgi:tetratricopeptide (TPR) repeat protein